MTRSTDDTSCRKNAHDATRQNTINHCGGGQTDKAPVGGVKPWSGYKIFMTPNATELRATDGVCNNLPSKVDS
jgi:hypothetical protein